MDPELTVLGFHPKLCLGDPRGRGAALGTQKANGLLSRILAGQGVPCSQEDAAVMSGDEGSCSSSCGGEPWTGEASDDDDGGATHASALAGSSAVSASSQPIDIQASASRTARAWALARYHLQQHRALEGGGGERAFTRGP
jgi:hypothetical protein